VLQGPRSSVLGDLLGYYLNRLGLMKTPAYSAAELQCRCPPDFLQRLPNGLARVALSQLRGLPRNLARRHAVAQVYAQHLPRLGFKAAALPQGYDPVYLRYPLWVDDKNGLVAFMQAQEIGVGVWFNSTIHPHGVKYEDAGYVEGSCPNAEAAVRHVVNLPSHPRMSEKDALRVVMALRAYGKERGVAAQQVMCG
jgi:dTDP-4-amino-4,6-dideoxygalactose transaminase